MNFLTQPWPWYVAGPLIGLMVPALLLLGNRYFGMSATLRHICAAVLPAGIPFFNYDWKKERWNLILAAGIILGGWVAVSLLNNHEPVQVNPALAEEMARYGIRDYHALIPADVMNWDQVWTLKGMLLLLFGGFLVGFGTRYAGGCTSGHSIMGLSTLQLPSLIATVCFMIGGFLVANLVLPFILSL